jgi:hypothetical protein
MYKTILSCTDISMFIIIIDYDHYCYSYNYNYNYNYYYDHYDYYYYELLSLEHRTSSVTFLIIVGWPPHFVGVKPQVYVPTY